jgi:hypothetical protein
LNEGGIFLDKKMFLITGLLLLSIFSWLGCGEGTLELDTGNPGSPITKAKVRVDGEDKGTYDLAKIPTDKGIQIDLRAGGHVVGVDFLDREGNVVSSYGPKIVKIEAGQIERISRCDNCGQCVKIGRLKAETSRFEITEALDLTPSPDINTLKISKGAAVTKGVSPLIVEDKDGNQIDQFHGSAEFRFDDGILLLTKSQPNLVYDGNSSGRFTIYRGRKEDGDIIFEGTFATQPEDTWHLVMSPDNQVIEFTNQVSLEGVGKGKFQGQFLKGTAFAELKGDVFLISMDSELCRKP